MIGDEKCLEEELVVDNKLEKLFFHACLTSYASRFHVVFCELPDYIVFGIRESDILAEIDHQG